MTEENAVVPLFGGGPVEITDVDALTRALEDSKDDGATGGNDMSYMSFSGKKGTYKIGIDGRAPGSDEPFLVAMHMFELGWMCWKGGKPVAKRMALITAPAVGTPDFTENGPFDASRGEGWTKSRAITVRSLQNNEQCYFTTCSKSGVSAFTDLQRDVLARMKSGQDCWPIVNFGEEEFEAQGFKNSKPVIEVVAWVSADDVQKLSDPDTDPMSLMDAVDTPAPAPTPRKRTL